MAATINQVLADGSQFATIEFVSSGDAAGESGTIIDIGTLSGANGSGNERVRIKEIVASVASLNPNGGILSLAWGGPSDLFAIFGIGVSEIKIPFEPTSGFNGDIEYILSANTAATVRIKLEKLHGFPDTTARF